jgi:hypothetical protein
MYKSINSIKEIMAFIGRDLTYIYKTNNTHLSDWRGEDAIKQEE